MKVYGIQADLLWEDKHANFAKIRTLLDNEKIQADSLIVLPETFATGFSMNLKATTRNEPDQTESLSAWRKKICCVTAGLSNQQDGQKGSIAHFLFS